MSDDQDAGSWPAVEFESRPWQVSDAYISRAQRRMHQGDFSAAVPARIADAKLTLPAQLLAESEDALREIVRSTSTPHYNSAHRSGSRR
ncbi:hypothetical protein [Rhodococcus sp. 077-4]|uniref:hypothetical protein n=1 Tax=Rhodococcus sp. 077-4 TaxID=2789271 RepID=UPI0039F44EF8